MPPTPSTDLPRLRGHLLSPDSHELQYLPRREYPSLDKFKTGELALAEMSDSSRCDRCVRHDRTCLCPIEVDGTGGMAKECARCLRDGRRCSLWNRAYTSHRLRSKPRQTSESRNDDVEDRVVESERKVESSAGDTCRHMPITCDGPYSSLVGPAPHPAPVVDTHEFEAEAQDILDSVFNKGTSASDARKGPPVSHGLAPKAKRTSAVRDSPYHANADCYQNSKGGSSASAPKSSKLKAELIQHAEEIRKYGMRFGSWGLLREADYLVSFAKDLGRIPESSETPAWSPWDAASPEPGRTRAPEGTSKVIGPFLPTQPESTVSGRAAGLEASAAPAPSRSSRDGNTPSAPFFHPDRAKRLGSPVKKSEKEVETVTRYAVTGSNEIAVTRAWGTGGYGPSADTKSQPTKAQQAPKNKASINPPPQQQQSKAKTNHPGLPKKPSPEDPRLPNRPGSAQASSKNPSKKSKNKKAQPNQSTQNNQTKAKHPQSKAQNPAKMPTQPQPPRQTKTQKTSQKEPTSTTTRPMIKKELEMSGSDIHPSEIALAKPSLLRDPPPHIEAGPSPLSSTAPAVSNAWAERAQDTPPTNEAASVQAQAELVLKPRSLQETKELLLQVRAEKRARERTASPASAPQPLRSCLTSGSGPEHSPFWKTFTVPKDSPSAMGSVAPTTAFGPVPAITFGSVTPMRSPSSAFESPQPTSAFGSVQPFQPSGSPFGPKTAFWEAFTAGQVTTSPMDVEVPCTAFGFLQPRSPLRESSPLSTVGPPTPDTTELATCEPSSGADWAAFPLATQSPAINPAFGNAAEIASRWRESAKKVPEKLQAAGVPSHESENVEPLEEGEVVEKVSLRCSSEVCL